MFRLSFWWVAVTTFIIAGCKDAAEPLVPSSISAITATTQLGVVASQVSVPPAVIVKDQHGNPFSGATVAFAVISGGGSTGQASVTTTSNGIATAAGWMLGTAAGEQTLTASVASLAPVSFSASAAAGAAASLTKSGGDNQSGVVGAALSISPSVLVQDAYGNPKSGATVVFSMGGGGGSITGSAAVSNSNGIASLGAWTLGTIAGANTIVADLAPLGSLVFTATGVAGPAASLSKLSGDNQTGTPGAALTAQPTVIVKDSYGNAKEGAQVTFVITGGGGSVTTPSVATNASGVATPGSWTLGPSTGANTLSATTGSLPTVSFSATASTINFTIEGLTLTQSVQTFGGTVPLIAGKSAYLRVFGRASQPTTLKPQVRATLKTGSSTIVYDLPLPSAAPSTISEGTLSSSWNILIPANGIQQGTTIIAEIDPAGSISETNESDNKFPVSGIPLALDVRTPAPIRATFVPVLQIPNGLTGDVNPGNLSSFTSDALAMFPVASIDAAVHAPYSFSAALPASYDSVWSRLLSEVYALRTAEGSARNYYGVIKPAGTFGGTGLGYVGFGAAIGVDWTNWRSKTVAHEWGHNFGRLHANCGNPANPDPNYPYTTALVGVYGFDTQSQTLKSPSSTYDLMSYCDPAWISDYTYRAILTYRVNASLMQAGETVGRALLVWGRVSKDGIILEPSVEITAARVKLPRAGPYRIRGNDSSGKLLFEVPFDVENIPELPSTKHFAFLVPVTWSALETMTLVAGGRTATLRTNRTAAVRVNDQTPSVALVQRSGLTHVTWDEEKYPLAVVRDARTGEILSFARGGDTRIAGPKNRSLQVILSSGTRSIVVPVRE